MHFKIPALPFENGVWVFESGGAASTIQNITRVFDACLEKYGTVIGEKFILSLALVSSQTTNNKFPFVSMSHFREPQQTQNENGQLSLLYNKQNYIGSGDDQGSN